MFELPEFTVLSQQINRTLQGKTIESGRLGNKPHKFVWYNRTPDEFSELVNQKTIGKSYARGKWLFVPLEPDYVLLLGECGGKCLYHQANQKIPKVYHLFLQFNDASFFTMTTQMWGAMELYEQGQEWQRQYVKNMASTPIDAEFDLAYFSQLIDQLIQGKKRSVKSLLTQDQLIPGLGNAIAQDIMFHARMHPKLPLSQLTVPQRNDLYESIVQTVQKITALGGRADEYDLFDQPGGYRRLMDKHSVGKPCPQCGTTIEKMQYLGGTCYYCPTCQPLH